jgi:hypothetical protein
VALLPSVPPDVADRHAFDADRLQSVFHLVKLERLDNRFNFLHSSSVRPVSAHVSRARKRHNLSLEKS